VKLGALVAERAQSFHPDVVVGCNMPLDAQRRLRQRCKSLGIPFVFWLQDVYSRAIAHYLTERLGIVGSAIGRYYTHLEASLLRSSDMVVAISEKFREPLERWSVDASKVCVIPNWAPLSEIYPVEKDNAWARQHALNDKLVALYTGTLGLKHDPALLLELTQAGRADGLHVVIVSEGAGVDWLAREKEALALDNLTLLPFQPMELYPQVLGAGDILLAMVGAEAAEFSVPSKILSYLAAGKPIVASITASNDAATTIIGAGAGSVVAPGDSAAFARAVLTLAKDREMRRTCEHNARRFAESHFDIGAIADRFEDLFQKAIRPGGLQPELVPLGAR